MKDPTAAPATAKSRTFRLPYMSASFPSRGDATAPSSKNDVSSQAPCVTGRVKKIGIFGIGLTGRGIPSLQKRRARGQAERRHGGGEGKGAKKNKAGMPTFYELPEFLVNLNTDGKGLSFIKMTVVLELASQKDSEQISALQPRVVNDFNTYLRELRSSDLAGSTGLERLREELLMRVNKSVSPIQVSDILFKEIIVQ